MKADSTEHVPFNRQLWDRFVRMVAWFATDPETGRSAVLRFGALILFLFLINGLNVLSSYVGRDFMTAIADRDKAGFAAQAIKYLGVFAALTGVSVILRYTEESLGLQWREWLTRRSCKRYLRNQNYQRLNVRGELANPDQRIADDIKAFTVTTLSFTLMLLNSGFTVVAFAGVLWTISPLLLGVAVAYAGAGSYLAIRLGRPLVRLNYDQLDKEANFRSTLIELRENADSIALLRQEGLLGERLASRIGSLAANFREIIKVNRNLGFFTNGYNWLIQIIPALLVAPLYFDGKVEFGVITQSAMAFSVLVAAFSLIVTQFQSISSFAAVIARLGALAEAIDAVDPDLQTEPPAIAVAEAGAAVKYEHLSLRSPRSGRTLVGGLDLVFEPGRGARVAVPDETACAALVRAAAGFWETGEGRIQRPGPGGIMFLTERPHLPVGTLRELLAPDWPEHPAPEPALLEALRELGLESLPARFGGLDAVRDWGSALSLKEQQHLAAARVLLAAPRFAFLDRPEAVLETEELERLLGLFRQRSMGYVVFGADVGALASYDGVLEVQEGGRWRWSSVEDGRLVEQKQGGARPEK
jgi:putative ATP-binding cassette transporter